MKGPGNTWFAVLVFVLSFAHYGGAKTGTSTEIEIARQGPVLLMDRPASTKLLVDRLGDLYFFGPTNTTLQVFDSINHKISTLFTAQGTINDFALDSNADLWIAISSGEAGKIVKLAPSPGGYRAMASSEPQVVDIEGLIWPTAVAVDGSGNLYVADRKKKAVLKVNPNGGSSTFAATNLLNPHRIAVDAAGKLYIQDQELHFVLQYHQNAIIHLVPSQDGSDMTVDSSGNLYIAETEGVRIVDAEGKFRARLPMCPSAPAAVAVSSDGRVFASGQGGIFELPVANTSVYDFGDTILGRGSQGSLAICNESSARAINTGTLALNIAGANASEFTQTNYLLGGSREVGCSASVLHPKAMCMVTIHFSPTVTGMRSAVLSIKLNEIQFLIPLSGTGVL